MNSLSTPLRQGSISPSQKNAFKSKYSIFKYRLYRVQLRKPAKGAGFCGDMPHCTMA
jgi:hypothetical protein